ncbi:MAG: MFS transporter [Chloroflexota bacterium]
MRSPSWGSLYTLYLPAFVLALGTGVATPALPVFAKSFDISFGTASLVIVLNLAGMALSSVPTGLLIDRVGRRKIVIAGPLLSAVSSVLTATASSFPELLFWRFLNGWATGMWTMGRVTMIADTGGAARGRQITTLFSYDNAGRLVGPAVGGLLAAMWDVRLPFYVHAALSLLAVIPSLRMTDTAPQRTQAEHEAEASAPARSLLLTLLTFPIIMLFTTYFLTSLTRGALFGGSMNFYAVYAYDIDAAAVGLMAAAVSAVGIPVTIMAGHIMDRFGRKATIVPGFGLLGLSLLLMAGIAALSLPFGIFVAALIVVGLTQSLTGGSMQTLGSDVAPAHARGKFFGIWNTVGQFGTFLSPAIFGLLTEHAGSPAAFAFLGVSSLGGAALVGFLVKETLQARPAVAKPVTHT